jgi:integrase
MRILRDFLRKWATEEADPSIPKNNGRFSKAQRGVARPNKMHRFQREVLRELILILSNTGLRIGEALELKWSDLRHRKQKDGYEYLFINVRSGKTGSREVIPKKNAATYLNRLRNLYGNVDINDFIFRNYDGSRLLEPGITFRKILAQLKMLTGPDGNRRSLYSLRHTYITNELDMGDLSIYQIAQNAGTSVTYIERHYSHASVHQKAKQYAEPSIGVSNRADEDMRALFKELIK